MTRHKAYTKIPFAALFFAATLISPALHALNIPDYRFHTMPETSYYGGIHSIAKDSVGRMWFSGYDALFMYNGTSFVRMTDLVTNLSPNSYWSYGQVITDNRKGLYVGTNQGLLRFDYRKLEFEFVLEGNIGSVTANNDGTVWLIRNNGIESFSPERLPAVTRYPMPPEMSAPGRTLTLVCTKEYVYAASGGDLYRLNRETGQYVLFASVGGGSCVIRDVAESNGSVYVLTLMDGLYECDGNGRIGRYFRLPLEYEKSAGAKELHLDSQGIIWVATQSGLLLLEPLTASTQLLRSDLHYPYSLPNNSVWSIFPDPDGGIWVGTYGGKLAYMTFADNGVDYFKATPGGLNHPIVSCFEEDTEGNLWIGTEGGGINRWDRRDGRFVYYTQESRCGLTSNMIKKLWHDGNDRLLVSAFNGGMRVFDERQGRFSDLHMNHPASGQPLSVYDFAKEGDRGIWLTDPDAELMYKDASTGRVETVRLTDAQGNAVRIHIETLFHDERGDLWLVGHDGAYVVDPATRRILKRHYIAEAPYSVNNLCSYCVTSDSDIWFGTRGGGVNLLRRNGSYVNFRDRNGEGLEGKTVFGILEDTPSKDVWFSTNDGLYYYDHTDEVIRKSQIDIPNRCGAYYVRACYKTSKGEMLFGGTDGFILFTPGKIKYNDQKPKVYFTDLLINSRPAVPGTKNSPLEKAISTLSYRGGEGDVIELSHRQSNFEIRFSANSYLNAEKNQYAYRLLGHSERWSLLPQGQKAVQFFNLPAGNYVFEVKAANNDGLWGDEVSALGFRVHPSPFLSRWAYLVYAALLSAVAYFIWRYFTNKKIFEQRLELERIKEQNMKQLTQARINFFTNLFSNAIKYASENGYVGVRIYPARQDQRPESAPPAAGTEYIAFTVTNTGAEIPDDKKEAIFESFNHLSDRRPQFESSSGLGLAIVKELVGNLNGTITLRSGNSKVAFTVVLPFTLNAEKTDSAAESYEYTVSEIDNLLTESDVMAPNDRHDRKACNIVVIEDDPNLRSYLEQRLSKHYNVYTAANGSEGIAKAERICPQIVITDLMMPEADGFEVCRSLRSNIKTSHIPVIMLSALGKNTENKIKALECGANVFIDKPFDMDFLLKQVANLIRSQQELKERYSKKYIAEPSKITISSMDEELLKKAMNYIERNMDNSDYNVDSFVSDMSIGRTLLYQKINDITGMSIKEFIMDVRLKRSAQLLRESDLTISEISVLTGFANPKYFSICFKRHFELTPSEFKKKS